MPEPKEMTVQSDVPPLHVCFIVSRFKFQITTKHLSSDCTHFTWTDYNGGSCWMKRGTVSASDAHFSEDKLAVCGMVDNISHISWNENDSAFGCDFAEHDLANVKTSDNDCYNQCTSTEGKMPKSHSHSLSIQYILRISIRLHSFYMEGRNLLDEGRFRGPERRIC